MARLFEAGDPNPAVQEFVNAAPCPVDILAGRSVQLDLFDRTALDRWTDRNVTLLGDACHPMTPYMAQGAAMAIEDAAVLARFVDSDGDLAAGDDDESAGQTSDAASDHTRGATLWPRRRRRPPRRWQSTSISSG